MPADSSGKGHGGLCPRSDATVDHQPWGRLEWMVSGAKGNSDTLTLGRCYIHPGQQNPPHYHPNCDEVLHVIEGTIRHRVDDEYVEMTVGDTISIPQGAVHNATNTGSETAILLVCFSTAERQVVGE